MAEDCQEYRCLECSCLLSTKVERQLCSTCWLASCGKEDREEFDYD